MALQALSEAASKSSRETLRSRLELDMAIVISFRG
jgi:hypothetical protein